MNFTQLKYFVTVCEKDNNMTAASKALFVSQPSISKAVTELEKEFGVVLFDRDNHKLILTENGKECYYLAKEILKKTNTMTEEMHKMVSKNKTINIGIPAMTSVLFVPTILKDFRLSHPDIQFELYNQQSNQILAHIDDDSYDVAFINVSSQYDPDKYVSRFNLSTYDQYELITMTYCFCTSPQNPLAKYESVSYKDIGEEPLVLIRYDNKVFKGIENRFHDEGIQPNVLFYTDQISTIREMVSKGEASTFIFSQLIKPTDTISAIPLKNRHNSTIKMIIRKNKHISKEVLQFINFVKSYDISQIVK